MGYLNLTVAPTLEYSEKLKEPQVLKASSFLSIIVNIHGIPTPKVSWTLNGKPVTSSSHVKIEQKHNSSVLTIQSLNKEDAGKLVVTAENVVGKSTATFDITINGRKHCLTLLLQHLLYSVPCHIALRSLTYLAYT